MSTTTSSADATSTACGANVYQLPLNNAACGAVLQGNMSEAFDSCCKASKPVKYSNDCGMYCLAQAQTVDELQTCLTSKSNNYRGVFCNASLNATASAATTTAATSTGTSTASSSTENAAVLNQPISKTGLGLVAMLFCSALVGVVA